MLSKATVRLIRSLHQKKFRKKHGLFIVEGEKSIRELIRSEYSIRWIFSTQSKSALVPSASIVSSKELKMISGLDSPDGLIAVAHIPKDRFNIPSVRKTLVLALDGITDPGNLGSIIRTADWFGIKHLFCSRHCVDTYNPKVVQATMGSLFRVRVSLVHLTSFLDRLKPTPVYGAVLKGTNLFTANLSNRGVIIIGGESQGISQEILKRLDIRLTIPSVGETSSLNAGVASGIICSEFMRRGLLG